MPRPKTLKRINEKLLDTMTNANELYSSTSYVLNLACAGLLGWPARMLRAGLIFEEDGTSMWVSGTR